MSFFLSDEPPVCIAYELLTVEHILRLLCSDLIKDREQHFSVRSLRMLCKDVSFGCVFDYLKISTLFGQFEFFVTFVIRYFLPAFSLFLGLFCWFVCFCFVFNLMMCLF